jgi:hypothetical protein
MLSHNSTLESIDQIIIAINRLPVDFQVITFKDIYKRAPELKNHPVITDWIAKHAHIIF